MQGTADYGSVRPQTIRSLQLIACAEVAAGSAKAAVRAAVLERPGELLIRSAPDPVAGVGEIAVDVSVCGVCRTDLQISTATLKLATPDHPRTSGDRPPRG